MATETTDGTPYYIGWVFLLILLLATIAKARSFISSPIMTTEFKNFQRIFIHIYLIALGSEWLQSCYLFVLLHKSYGFTSSSIAWMFIAGFIACQVIGMVWDLLDIGSRKGRCMLCLGLQAASCLLMQIGGGSFGTLVAARVLAGVASSVLQGSFEQWMVDQHRNQGFPDDWLSHTFNQLSYSTAKLAAAVGVAGELSVAMFGFRGPFFVSMLLSLAGMGLMSVVWRQDLHQPFVPPSQVLANLKASQRAIQANPKVLHTILVQSSYEVAICLFAFLWTPLLNVTLPHTEGSAPYGLIFSIYLISIMVGSFLFKIISEPSKKIGLERAKYTPTVLCHGSFLAGAISFALLSVASSQYLVVFFSIMFQLGVGIFYPAMGTLRGGSVTPDARLIILNGAKVMVAVLSSVLLALLSHSFILACLISAGLLLVGSFSLRSLQKNISLNIAVPKADDGKAKGKSWPQSGTSKGEGGRRNESSEEGSRVQTV